MLRNVSIAAAVAVLGSDLLVAKNWRTENYPRTLIGIGVCGSTAAGDTGITIKVNGIALGDMVNLDTGWPTKDHILPVNIPVPANALLEFEITSPAATNPINVVAVFDD